MKRIILALTSLFILLASLFATLNKSPKTPNEVSNATDIKEEVVKQKTPAYDNAFKFSNESSLKDVVQGTLQGAGGLYGIGVKNLSTGETYFYNEHKVLESASLYKLWVMALVYQEIQAGNLQKNATISNALDTMITVSDNDSAFFLTETVGMKNLTTFLSKTGLYESDVGSDEIAPTTTVYDVSSFYEKLYRGKLANIKNTQEMLDLLKKQQLNNGIPKYLPINTEIAHKTGELGGFTHDTGIIYESQGDYILVVMSEGSSKSDAEELIAQISKNIYDYFKRNSL